MKMTPNFAPLDRSNLAGDIANQLRLMTREGRLNPGDKLPSSRKLAVDLGVARGTVIVALDTLIAEGVLESQHGSGTFVSTAMKSHQSGYHGLATPPPLGELFSTPEVDPDFSGALNFQACRPSMEAFPQANWRKAMADAASRLPSADYGDPQGELELRIAIASYLCRARGMDVNPDQILITNGAINAVHLIAQLYLRTNDGVVIENPGYPLARQIFELASATLYPVPVDQDGLQTEKLPRSGTMTKLIYVTPSHQFPTGARMSLERRQQLIAWAQQNDALILEDDYDGEFRYDIAPLPPMAAMTTSGFVMYLGTFSKTLFPSLRLGFAAGNTEIIQRLTSLRTTADYQTNVTTQLALANFISSGDFERHVHRMRRIYTKKRACLQRAIKETDFPGELLGMNSGLNALVKLKTDLSATNITHRAKLHNMSIPAISRYDIGTTLPDDAMVLGYAALSEAQIEQGIKLLARLIRETT